MKEGLSIEGEYICVWEDSIIIIQLKKPAKVGLREIGAYTERFLTDFKFQRGKETNESSNQGHKGTGEEAKD